MSVARANDFIERRPRFYAHYLLKYKFPANALMHRGLAVELGVRAAQYDRMPLGLAIDAALESFDIATRGEDPENSREQIPALVEAGSIAIEKLIAEHGPIVGFQKKVESFLPDGLINWIGFTDFTMLDKTIIDLKITGRVASEIPQSYGRQGSFYRHASKGCGVKFVCLTPATKGVKSTIYELGDHTPFINQLRMTEYAIDSVLQLGYVEDLAACFMPNPDDYTFRDDESRAIATKIWGLQWATSPSLPPPEQPMTKSTECSE